MGSLVSVSLLLAVGVASAEPTVVGFQRMPVPAGVSPTAVTYGSISCPTTTWCTATGATSTGGPYVVVESHGTWGKPSAIELPAGATRGWLDVTCPSVGNCTAAGTYVRSGGGYAPLVASESDGSWQAAESYSLPAGATTGASEWAYDAAPWCASAGNCIIVGTYQTATCGGASCGWGLLAVQQSAGVLGVPTTLDLNSAHPMVPMLGCSSAGNCLVVAGGASIAEVGGTWQQSTGLPAAGNPSSFFDPNALSCASTGGCVLVGTLEFPKFWAAASVTWADEAWGAIRPLPRPAHDPLLGDSEMDGISCKSATCVAVGRGGGHWCFGPPGSISCARGTNYAAVAATWNEGSWSVTRTVQLPAPRGFVEPGSWLDAVSCASKSTCVAVGQDNAFRSASGLQTLWPFSELVRS